MNDPFLDPITEEEIEELLDAFEGGDESAIEVEVQEELICACGSDKCGSPIHSDWCPKFEKT
jgi:hypothetical protein